MKSLTALAATLALLIIPALHAVTPGAGPIQIKPGGFLEKDHQQKRLEWAMKHLLPTAKVAWKGKPWAADATRLCEQGLAAWIQGNNAHTTLADLAPQADKLRQDGCDEALACFICHLCQCAKAGNWRGGLASHKLAQSHPADVLTPAALTCWIGNAWIEWVLDMHRLVGDAKAAEQAERVMRATADGSYSPEFDDVFLRDQMHWLANLKMLPEEGLTKLIETWRTSAWPEWVRLTLIGQAETRRAWDLRGGGWASTVSQTGWDGFAKHIRLAHEALEQAWKLRPDRPEAASLMITVAMAESLPPPALRQWFDRSVAAQFDYQPAYRNLLWAYDPRWVGSDQLVLEFGKACADTARFDTQVPAQLFQACRAIAVEKANPRGVFSHPLVAASIAATAQGYLEIKDVSAVQQRAQASQSAIAAWFAGDAKLAAQALKAAGPQLSGEGQDLLKELLHHEDGIRRSIAAATGEWGPEIQQVEALSNTGDLPATRTALEQIDPAKLPSDDARSYLAEGRAWITFTDELKKGGWHPLPLYPGLSSFASIGGKWTFTANGNLLLDGDDSQFSDLVFGFPMPENIELRCEFTYTPPKRDDIGFGWAFGPVLAWTPELYSASHNPMGVRGGVAEFRRDQRQATITRTGFNPPTVSANIPAAEVNTCHLAIKDGTATLTTNDNPPVTVPLDKLKLERRTGLAGLSGYRIPKGGRVIVRKVELRLPE